jgi:hypothetical protein
LVNDEREEEGCVIWLVNNERKEKGCVIWLVSSEREGERWRDMVGQ